MNPVLKYFLLCLVATISLQAKKPNILLIVADDMGWNDIGYVNPRIKTPNLDRLASEGVRFERFYANPVCSVTRAALMSGRASLITGVSNRRGLPLNYPIMAESFKDAGYATWMLGKWHLGGSSNNRFNSPDYLAHNRGFDHFYGHLNGALHYLTHTVASAGGVPDWWRNGEAVEEEGFQTELLTNEAIELIEERDAKTPFYLYLAYHAPHTPLSPTPTGMELYADIENESQRLVYANTTFMDSEIGRLIDVLEERDELEDTLIVFLNDNGGVPRIGSSNLPLRSQKGTVYEGGIRVRALARWPRFLPEASISFQFMSVMDLYPTLASAAGISLPNTLTLDGHDLWKAIVANREVNRPDFVMGNADIAVFRPPWKLIIPAIRGEPQLFDIVNDPYEKEDVIDKNQKIAAALNKVGRDMIAKAEVSPRNNAAQVRGGRGGRSVTGGRAGGGRLREGGPGGGRDRPGAGQ